MRTSSLQITLSLLLATAATLAAQQARPPATGSVSGTVTCSDTQRPARFAQVVLFGVPTEASPSPKPDAAPDTAQITAAIKSSLSANLVQTQTGIDGQYTAASVAPGDYYLFASVGGYLQPTNMVQAAQQAGADLSKPIPGLQIVHVVGERTIRADVSVQRGAAISGKVLWDDGSPVTHAVVSVIAAKGKEKPLPSPFGMLAMSNALGALLGITDDVGHFRLSGLAAGDYLVKATLQTQLNFAMQGGVMNLNAMIAATPLVVFAPAAFHQTDAKPVTLHVGDDRADAEVTFNLAGLHSVSGTIAAADTHHAINSGTVKLEDAVDKEFSRSGSVDASGNFTVTFVPSGTYNLTISDGGDTEAATKDASGKPNAVMRFTTEKTLRSYEAGKLTVIVTDTDLTGQNLELTPSKSVRQGLDLGGILNPSN